MADDIVTVNTYSNPHEADMAKLLLEEEGITVFLDNRFIVETDWFISNAVGNNRLQVPADQAEHAAELLESVARRRKAASDNANADDDEFKCLSCGHAMGEDEDTCPQCGWTFAGDEEPEAK